ncbi:hypothetical protein GCM10027570_34750 [Streptomonospora sediminis]
MTWGRKDSVTIATRSGRVESGLGDEYGGRMRLSRFSGLLLVGTLGTVCEPVRTAGERPVDTLPPGMRRGSGRCAAPPHAAAPAPV